MLTRIDQPERNRGHTTLDREGMALLGQLTSFSMILLGDLGSLASANGVTKHPAQYSESEEIWTCFVHEAGSYLSLHHYGCVLIIGAPYFAARSTFRDSNYAAVIHTFLGPQSSSMPSTISRSRLLTASENLENTSSSIILGKRCRSDLYRNSLLYLWNIWCADLFRYLPINRRDSDAWC